MLPAAPVDREDDLARGVVVIGDDVGDECAQQYQRSSSHSLVATPAACIRRLARCMSARVRWGSLIPRSRIDSNAMVIWWGCAGGNRAFNDIFRDLVIGFLLDDMGIATGASPKSAFQE
jgi:hypothetical protein